MWHWSKGDEVGGEEEVGVGKGGLGVGGKESGQRAKRAKGQRTAVSPLVSHQFCNTIAQESSRTDKRRCSHIHIKLSMYNCIQRRAPPTTLTNT